MDNIPLHWQYSALAILLLLSAFFSMSETALMSINRYRLRHLVKQGHKGAKITHKLLMQTEKLLGVILLCNNFVNTALATLVTVMTVHLFGEGELTLMFSTLAVTFSILIFSEISPKVIAAAHAEKVGIFVSYILYPLLRILYPLVWFVNLFVDAWLKILGIKINFGDGTKSLSMEELRSIVTDSGKFLPTKHRSILLNLFELEKIEVDDVMIAHTQVEAINFDGSLDEILDRIANSHHTRLPVREGDAEEIFGILHIRKVMNLLRLDHDMNKDNLREIVSDPYFIPSGTPLYTQIQQFQENKERVALVVDEYGELKGLITLEDILEEVIGDFTTQSPSLVGSFFQEEDGGWLVDGSSSLRDLNKKLKLSLPLDGPRTLNGLVLEHFQDIPDASTSFKIGSHVLEVVHTQDRVVKSVKIFP